MVVQDSLLVDAILPIIKPQDHSFHVRKSHSNGYRTAAPYESVKLDAAFGAGNHGTLKANAWNVLLFCSWQPAP